MQPGISSYIGRSDCAFVSSSLNVELVVRYIPFPKLASLMENFGHGLAFLQMAAALPSFSFIGLMWIMIALQAWLTLKGVNFHMPLAATTLVMVGAAIGSVAQIPGYWRRFSGCDLHFA